MNEMTKRFVEEQRDSLPGLPGFVKQARWTS
jgi:hypothetical protein